MAFFGSLHAQMHPSTRLVQNPQRRLSQGSKGVFGEFSESDSIVGGAQTDRISIPEPISGESNFHIITAGWVAIQRERSFPRSVFSRLTLGPQPCFSCGRTFQTNPILYTVFLKMGRISVPTRRMHPPGFPGSNPKSIYQRTHHGAKNIRSFLRKSMENACMCLFTFAVLISSQ